MAELIIRLLTVADEMSEVEELQRLTWPGSETDVIPAHMLLAAIHNGGLAIGAYSIDHDGKSILVGVVFGFPGITTSPSGPRLKHHSHILAVRPEYRAQGIAFSLKRAQWQMVRNQGIDLITWTYDPLLSRNAHLNIARLGGVCCTYLRSEYGEMRDGLNAGLPSDRFQVDWWVHSRRVERRISRQSRSSVKLEQVLASQPTIIAADAENHCAPPGKVPVLGERVILMEIPDDFLGLKQNDSELSREWRFFTRELFELAFISGYLVTDFVHDSKQSYYVLTHGESTL